LEARLKADGSASSVTASSDQAVKAHQYREREELEQPMIPEKVMVAIASCGSAKKLLRVGSRVAGRLASDWYAVYVETPSEELGRIKPEDFAAYKRAFNLQRSSTPRTSS
jgi:two-component system, OmpR family, sensor histidine kinase KdpD